MVLSLLLACSGAPDAAPPAPPATPTPVAAPAAPAPTLAAAPSVEAYGLQIGRSTAAEVDAWVAARKLTCRAGPSVRRTTYRYDCKEALPPDLLGGERRGALTNLLLVRGDTTPLNHLSSIRKYSLPADAVADYGAAVARLGARFGAPTRASEAPDPAQLTGKVAHWATSWAFADLNLRVVLLKAGTETISLSEIWDLPGSEAHESARPSPGGNPHAPHP